MSRRPAMLASEVRKIIAPVLQECSAVCGVVSITDIEVTTDLSYVTVLISALADSKRALSFLESRQKSLQMSLGTMSLKKIPKIRFRIDPRTERGSRIEELLGDM